MLTLKYLEKIMYSNTSVSPSSHIKYLSTFLPDSLYNNSDSNLNIGLTSSIYENTRGWLSHLMNSRYGTKSTIKSGVERVRKQLISIILDNPNLCYELESNFEQFIQKVTIDKNLIIKLIEGDSNLDSSVQKHLESCIKNNLSHGLTLTFLCALLPNHISSLQSIKIWTTPHPLSGYDLSNKQHQIIHDLLHDLASLINSIKKSCVYYQDYSEDCFNSLQTLDSDLISYKPDLPPEIYEYFHDLYDLSSCIYLQLFNISSNSYTDLYVCSIEKAIELEQSYNLLCSFYINITSKKEP